MNLRELLASLTWDAWVGTPPRTEFYGTAPDGADVPTSKTSRPRTERELAGDRELARIRTLEYERLRYGN